MELEKNRQERLSILLANPHQVDQQDISLLKDLAQRFPYFEPLHVLLSKANPADPEMLSSAAFRTNGRLLHKILKQTAAAAAFEFQVEDQQKEKDEPLSIPQNSPEEEVFEEINEVDVNEFLHPEPKLEDPSAKIETIEDAFVLESISASDFFAFEENFHAEENKIEVPEAEEAEKPTVASPTGLALPEEKTSGEPISVSNYNDDSLPYTFLWWLAKTRKEHQSIFQPYATPKENNSGELQQQYVEHIFHIQSPFNASEVINNTPQNKHADPKDAKIIDNFLKKDPQISPPKPEQIDNENKAKKSAEDHNDLVSETLAKIYIEQMLYHKAIDTYQKLSLKFPEKSRYFADLIQSLEKKI